MNYPPDAVVTIPTPFGYAIRGRVQSVSINPSGVWARHTFQDYMEFSSDRVATIQLIGVEMIELGPSTLILPVDKPADSSTHPQSTVMLPGGDNDNNNV